MSKNNQDSAINKQDLVSLYREALKQGQDLTRLNQKIEKMSERTKVSQRVEKKASQQKEEQLKKSVPRVVRWSAFALPIIFILVGVGLISNALMPITEYYLKTAPQLNIFDLKTPIPRENVLDITPQVIAQAGPIEIPDQETTENFGPVIIKTQLDYTNLANWFGSEEIEQLGKGQETDSYKLEIPQLDILNAEVKIGGTNLDQSLIQYPGTADPGKPGSAVIFGHSVLRQFYNPYEKNPRRYISIFSKIMTLNNGDRIFIEKGGIKYQYRVVNKTEVKPDDTFILTQNYESKRIKLVTCVPEGTYLRRGVITAELVE